MTPLSHAAETGSVGYVEGILSRSTREVLVHGDLERQATLLSGLTPDGFVQQEHSLRRNKHFTASALRWLRLSLAGRRSPDPYPA